jgi:hypothetical protein
VGGEHTDLSDTGYRHDHFGIVILNGGNKREGLAIEHVIDGNVFIPMWYDTKVLLNLSLQYFQEFCRR